MDEVWGCTFLGFRRNGRAHLTPTNQGRLSHHCTGTKQDVLFMTSGRLGTKPVRRWDQPRRHSRWEVSRRWTTASPPREAGERGSGPQLEPKLCPRRGAGVFGMQAMKEGGRPGSRREEQVPAPRAAQCSARPFALRFQSFRVGARFLMFRNGSGCLWECRTEGRFWLWGPGERFPFSRFPS